MNLIESSAENYLIINRTLPWLQDTAQEHVKSNWQAEYRDVRILDWRNDVQAVYNLSIHDLQYQSNRVTLKNLFLDVAKSSDTDQDGLPDGWEIHHFGNVASGPDEDPDADGYNNRTEFAFGTDPRDPSSYAPMKAAFSRLNTTRPVVYTFRRPAGSIMNYFIETSPSAHGVWSVEPGALTVEPARNLYDGTGTVEVNCRPTATALQGPAQFMRVRAAKP